MSNVPQSYLGVWKRRLIMKRSGQSDRETAVFWLQTPRLFADLRIPPEGQMLCEQKGFAGFTEVKADICQWHRSFDFQPVSGDEDIGRMHFETSERLIETALDDEFYEIWERLPDSRGIARGQWLHAVDDSTRQGCLLLAGDYFLFAASRPFPLQSGGHLRDLMNQCHNDAERCALLACELSFGRHGTGNNPWHITHSTIPANVGQCLLSPSVDPMAADLFEQEAALSSLGTFAPAGGWRCAPEPQTA